MFNVTGGELFMILLVALIVLGPERLPSAARRVGKVMGQIRDLSEGFKREVSQAIDDPSEPIVKPATRPRLTALDGGVASQAPAEASAGPSGADDAAATPDPAEPAPSTDEATTTAPAPSAPTTDEATATATATMTATSGSGPGRPGEVAGSREPAGP